MSSALPGSAPRRTHELAIRQLPGSARSTCNYGRALCSAHVIAMGVVLKEGLEASAPPQAAVEEGIVIGGGCTFLKLARKVDDIKATLENDEQRVRASYPCCCFFVTSAAKAAHLSIAP